MLLHEVLCIQALNTRHTNNNSPLWGAYAAPYGIHVIGHVSLSLPSTVYDPYMAFSPTVHGT